MAHRKLQQEIDKVLKKVSEGVVIFDGLYDKIQECENQPQKEKLEDSLKKEIKKLQRNRDQLKTWAQMSEIKDKKPLLDNRKLIETKMEMFKAVEKEMKTKAYSKEGLATSAKKDPKEQEKEDTAQFVRDMQDELRLQIESREAEIDVLNAGKKGKKDSSKDVRKQTLTDSVERHKWHEDKLELILRALENGNVEPTEVKDLQEGIEYYVKHNEDMDFMEDDMMYDELNLTDSEQVFGMNTDNNDLDKVSSEDAQELPDQAPEANATKPVVAPVKQKAAAPVETTAARRPSTQLKSPLPVLATLNTLSSNAQTPSITAAKPAPVPIRAPGEPLRYASAAAAATINDKNGIGIAPLPPGPGPSAAAVTSNAIRQPSVGASPHSVVSVPVQQRTAASTPQTVEATLASKAAKSPAPSHASHADATSDVKATSQQPPEKHEPVESSPAIPATAGVKLPADDVASVHSLPNGSAQSVQPPETESVFHLPSGLEDILESWEATKAESGSAGKPIDERLLATSHASLPESVDAERPRHYRPQNPYPFVPESYPQEPLAIFDDPRLYSRIETDALFYAFYYRQGTYQQYLAAKALKAQSWRFHKQYQTWFQRHEEPKAITEEFEQGTYRFFDYESTWMNRRKADFKFAYKFLEDDL